MKKLLSGCIAVLFSVTAFAQDAPKTTISVTGNAQITLYPVSYKVRFFLQEDAVSTVYNKPVTKTSLDSIRTVFFSNLKAYGYPEADLKLIKKSSTPYNNGANTTALYNEIYELKKIKADAAEKLVTDFRFNGLKGIVARAQYALINRAAQDSIYAAAIKDGHSSAVNLAKEVGKTVGEVFTIGTYNNAVFRDINNDYDASDIYSLSRFEMSLADSRIIPVTINISYELKKN
jgi:uncharacterized protein YggE